MVITLADTGTASCLHPGGTAMVAPFNGDQFPTARLRACNEHRHVGRVSAIFRKSRPIRPGYQIHERFR